MAKTLDMMVKMANNTKKVAIVAVAAVALATGGYHCVTLDSGRGGTHEPECTTDHDCMWYEYCSDGGCVEDTSLKDALRERNKETLNFFNGKRDYND